MMCQPIQILVYYGVPVISGHPVYQVHYSMYHYERNIVKYASININLIQLVIK